eukprot:Plantae.Rhodophyta-Hildenbrandia_rubra.ctg7145.p1 GENE.Plantae.Rhodophyta-Hildenbrandia_rubra.ctg7145~~Plantae.Rhodophyta-Hildenbrandia_rubra.ctg7145.p1  ORF type:complete len:430 (-),score=76.64 Plantae.Rhodophyta-Hildenbrandia_rubra.ctg7145:1019-2308(-)
MKEENIVPISGGAHGRGHEQKGEDGRDLDITWAQAAEGIDIQGIPWEDLPFTRADYRATRLRDGREVEASGVNNGLGPIIERKPRVKDIKEDVNGNGRYYCFRKNTRRAKCSILHFQLRNLVWATSRHDVYIQDEDNVYHWDAAACRKRLELSLSGDGQGGGVSLADNVAPLGHVQISTTVATDDWLIAGGFYGEIVAKNLKTNTIMYNKRIALDDNGITNSIDIFDDKIMVSNNDKHLRVFDENTFSIVSQRQYTCAINQATKQPKGNLVAIVGDVCQAFVVDDLSGDKVATLNGHIDFSFATAWHPDGVLFATGSQDGTCRVWDRRRMSESVVTLGGRMGAMRSVRFSSCGRFLAMAEPRDFVHIYDVSRGDFGECQEIDLFGEIAGISFSPDGHSLFLGIWDQSYGSLLEFEREVSDDLSRPNACA